jgi:NADH-quinone oxidoreductase subunit N
MYLTQLSPELCMIAGACIAFLFGVSKNAMTRSAAGPIALATLLAAMAATWAYGSPTNDPQPAGLFFTGFVLYVRWITLTVGVLLLLVNWQVPIDGEKGEYFGLVLCSMAGVMLTAAANDLVVLFFAIELVSVPTYALIALSRTDHRASEASVKYFFLGALAAAVMVYGFSFIYGVAGTTTLQSSTGDSIADAFAGGAGMNAFWLIGMLLSFAGLSFKVAAVPFHAYAPDVYEGAASPLTGLLGFLPKLAGFAAMIKLLSLCHWDLPEVVMWMMWVVAAVTMTVGNVLALLQSNVKRILAYSSISHTGYMLIGVLVGPMMGQGPMRDGVAALLFYIAVYGVMNLGAFAVLSGLSVRGQAAETLSDLAGLSRRAPLAALAMAICVFSLMGFPPTAGFLGKVYLFSSAFSLESTHAFRGPLVALAVIAVINSAIGAAYYLRIVAACFLREPNDDLRREGGAMLKLGIAICSMTMLVLFIRPNQLTQSARSATTALQSTTSSAFAAAPLKAADPEPL